MKSPIKIKRDFAQAEDPSKIQYAPDKIRLKMRNSETTTFLIPEEEYIRCDENNPLKSFALYKKVNGSTVSIIDYINYAIKMEYADRANILTALLDSSLLTQEEKLEIIYNLEQVSTE